MKKLLTIIVLSILLFSCSSKEYEYTLIYKVYYSENVIKMYKVTSNESFYIGSNQGTNYIQNGAVSIISTSAPIEIIKYTKTEIIKEDKKETTDKRKH